MNSTRGAVPKKPNNTGSGSEKQLWPIEHMRLFVGLCGYGIQKPREEEGRRGVGDVGEGVRVWVGREATGSE